MAVHNKSYQPNVMDVQSPMGLTRLCDELDHIARHQLGHVSSTLAAHAPRPGQFVAVEAKPLAIELNGLDVVLFSAVDATTLLQVAQLYVTMTTPSALTFVDFAASMFPFAIQQVVTLEKKPFCAEQLDRNQCNFSELMKEKGYAHVASNSSAEIGLYRLLAGLTYGGMSDGVLIGTAQAELQRGLNHFLFFHNNYRSIPWIDGLTPLQKLQGFREYASIHSFDPVGYPGRKGSAVFVA